MKFKELLNLSDEELNSRKLELNKELMKLRATTKITPSPADAGKIKSKKRDIAKILTLLNQRKK